MSDTSEYSIRETLNLSESYAKRVGNDVVGELEGEADGGRMEGRVVEHGSHTVLLMAAEPWEYLLIRYPFSIDQVYAVRRLGGPDISEPTEITDQQIQTARTELENRLNEMSEADRRRFRLTLVSELSRGPHAIDLDTTKPLNIHGFNVDAKVFVHQDGVGINDFAETEQRVVSVGWLGKELMFDNYGFRSPE